MLILAFETSAKAASVALLEDGKLLGESYQNTGLTHSQTIMVMAEDLLKQCGRTVSDLTALGVANGPGSFTGIRIGVSAAKGLAFAADKPAVGVSTLAAMARNVAWMDGLVVCAMDARRQQVYNALFPAENGRLTRLTPDRAISLEDLAAEIKADARPKIIVGDGARLCYNDLSERGISCRMAPAHLVMQNAVSVALEAEELAGAGQLLTAQELQPVYLRPAQAQRLRDRV